MYVIQPSWCDLYTLKYVMYALLALELSNTCICISGACFMNRSWAFISWLIGEKVKAKGGGWPWYPPWGQMLIEVEFCPNVAWAHLRNLCAYYYSIVWSRISASYCHNFWSILWELFRQSFRLTPRSVSVLSAQKLAYRIIPSRLLHFINVRAVAWLPHNVAKPWRLDFMDSVSLG